MLELSPEDHINFICVLTEVTFPNCKIIDKTDHWSVLLYKNALAIRRLKPNLHHGTKASKDIITIN